MEMLENIIANLSGLRNEKRIEEMVRRFCSNDQLQLDKSHAALMLVHTVPILMYMGTNNIRSDLPAEVLADEAVDFFTLYYSQNTKVNEDGLLVVSYHFKDQNFLDQLTSMQDNTERQTALLQQEALLILRLVKDFSDYLDQVFGGANQI
jgi:hypothetical protein